MLTVTRTRTNPFFVMDDMWRSLDRLMGQDTLHRALGATSAPRFTAHRTEAGLELKAELPGVSPEDLEIHAEGGVLRVEGAFAAEAPEGYRALRTERQRGRFARAFEIPEDLDADSAEARFDHGVLTLTFAKRPERQPKRIEIKAS